MERNGKKKRRKRYCGRHLMLIGALALLVWAGYELWIRMDDFQAWTSGVRYMSAARQESFLGNLSLILQAPEMRELTRKLLFLIGCAAFSVVALCLRSRPCADVVLFVLDAALIGCGCYLKIFRINFSLLPQTLKLIPLLLILAGCVLNFVQFCIRRRNRRRKKARGRPQPPVHQRHAA